MAAPCELEGPHGHLKDVTTTRSGRFLAFISPVNGSDIEMSDVHVFRHSEVSKS